MIQDCASRNKIKENKYKILRMSLLLGSGEDREETLNNFEDAAREIDAMNDEIYLRDLEGKFYDTLKLEEEEKKLAVLVDYIGGRVEQRISLLSDFANVTGYDLTNLPPIKYYDKLDDYKERLKYIREYLQNIEEITQLNKEIDESEKKLKDAYMNKATSEECNGRNEEILLNKFENLIKSVSNLNEIDDNNIESKLNEITNQVEESKKSLDIFYKSFTTLSGSGISYEEEEEYKSYVDNAKEVYYTNKEQEYLLKLYQYLLKKENEYNSILVKRETINDILYERMDLRKELKITEPDILSNIYELLERQYEDIKRQKDNIENIEYLTEEINNKKDKVNELELDNQKVEILALLREFCMIDTYSGEEPKLELPEEKEINSSIPSSIESETSPKEELPQPEDIPALAEEETTSQTSQDFFDSPSITAEPTIKEEPVKENQVILVENASNIDLDFIHAKANKVMQRVGEMLGIKPVDTKIVTVTNEESTPSSNLEEKEEKEETLPENPLFNNELANEDTKKEEVDPENSFWFSSDTPDALNELPDLEVSNNNFFTNSNIPDLNFPDLKINFDNSNGEEKE